MEDANHHLTSYTYDENNLLVSVTDPLNHATSHTYDANGNRATTLDANGHTTTYVYDELNRLTNIAYDDGTSVAYSYDPAGNRLTMVDSLGTTSYTYDDLYRALSISSPTGTTNYTYDAVNRLTLTTPAGTTTYTYDAADRMLTVSDWQNQVTTYTYDAAGRQTGIAYSNGVTTTNTYDNADRLTNINTVNGATMLSSISYTMDNVGNRLTMVDNDGTTTYTYDELNRLLTVAYPVGSPANISYTYDPMGNRLTMTEDGVVTTYVYNDADQLTSTIRNSVTTAYTWDNNGNMLTMGSQTFTWDRAGRMAGLTNGGTTASYRYNGDGVRLGKTVNGMVTDYLQDQAAGLPAVVRETAGGTISDYVYGMDMIAINSGGWSFFHTDGLGSTRAITNSSGTVAERYGYDAFGGERSHTGSSTQPFTYTGEQVDPEVGFVYLRARYYDPTTGRFISRDNYSGIDHPTQSNNSYSYAENNPVALVDPNGHFAHILVGAGVGAAINAAWYLAVDVGIERNSFDGRKLAAKVASGAVTGGLTAAIGPAGIASSSLITGAVNGAIGYTVEHIVTGENMTAGGFIGETAMGGVGGYIGGKLVNGIESLPGYLKPSTNAPLGQLALFEKTYGSTQTDVFMYETSKKLLKNIFNYPFKRMGREFDLLTRQGLIPQVGGDIDPSYYYDYLYVHPETGLPVGLVEKPSN